MIVLKIGGRALEESLKAPRGLASYISSLNCESGGKALILHGAGSQITQWAEKAGLPPSRFLSGYRVTDEAMLEIVSMVLLQTNASLCVLLERELKKKLCLGLSGMNLQLLQAKLLNEAQLGRVGIIEKVHVRILENLQSQGILPILAPLALAIEDGKPCNVNADKAACALALNLKAKKLIFLTETPGILDAEGGPLSRLTLSELSNLIESASFLQGGMRLKASCAFEFLENTDQEAEVYIASLRAEGEGGGIQGTWIRRSF